MRRRRPIGMGPGTTSALAIWLVLAVAVVLVAAGCSDGADDEGDLASFCAVAGGRDLRVSLQDLIDEGPPDGITVPEGDVDAEMLEGFGQSFANIVEEDSPSDVRDDAEVYAAALRSTLDGDPPTGADREQALDAGQSLSDYLDSNCPTA